jgi:DNA invertase Pin-like site-specific DNA recombinase
MRNTEDHFTVRSQLAAAGVMLRCATQRIDETPEGRLFETIAAGFAEYDNNKRRQKTVAGMIACLAKRRWPFQAPLGYLKIRAADGHPNLAPHPQLAAHIRRAFERAAAGCSRRTILAELRASVDS